MKHLWFKDDDGDIWKVPKNYSYVIVYYKEDNFIPTSRCSCTKDKFNNYKKAFNGKRISQETVFLEML